MKTLGTLPHYSGITSYPKGLKMNKTPQRIMRELSQPFNQDDIEWRPQQIGGTKEKPNVMLLAYVTNRAMQQRLDDVVGCFGWKNEFTALPNSVGEGALCGISIKLGDEWVTKWDGADNTAIEATKGGLSGSMKRAVVQWGVGRYLYDVETMWGICITQEEYNKLKYNEKQGYNYAQAKDKSFSFYWKPPKLEDKYLPQKYVGMKIVKEIEELSKETDTDLKDILNSYGVDDTRDLFATEAGQITAILAKRKIRLMEEKQNEE